MHANRLDSVSGSGTLASMDTLQRLRRQGIDVFTFSDRPPPPQVAVLAAKRALDEAWSSFYTPTAGLPLLRQILAERASRGFRRTVDADSEVLITVGGKEPIINCVMAIIEASNEVLIPDPAWVSYEPCVRLAGGIGGQGPSEYLIARIQARSAGSRESDQ
jgi:aspartate aminotransferase